MADEPSQLGQEEIDKLLGQPAPGTSAAGASSPLDSSLGQNEIDALLKGSPGTEALGAGAPGAAEKLPPRSLPRGEVSADIAQGDIEFLFNQAQAALESVDAPAAGSTPFPTLPFQLPEFGGAPPSTEHATLELLRDVELDLRIELGRTQMPLEDLLRLRKGSVVPLDKLAGDPVDIFVNGRMIARGEVLVMNDNFCVRVAELIKAESARAG